MAQYEMNLRDYWFIIRRRRVIIAVSTLLTAALSFWWAQQKVPIYQTTAAVKFEQSAALSGLLVEVLSYSSADSIETQTTLIKSTPVLEEVARQLGRLPASAGSVPATPGDVRAAAGGQAATTGGPQATGAGEPLRESKAYWNALDGIASKLRVARIPSTSILEITATSTDAGEAKDLANTVAQVYKRYSHDQRNARLIEARKFIEGQLRELDGRVRRAEEEVWAFRDANRVIAPGAESQVLLALFGQVRGDIERARQHRTELELIRERLGRDGVIGSDAVFIETTNPAIQRLLQLQNDLILERNQLALDVTERHPKLQALDDRIREVRVEMRRQVAGQIGALRVREEILNRQLADLMQKNRDVPAVELGLARRQRDAKYYEDQIALLKTKHQEALIKESEAIQEVQIVRPAHDPDTPVSSDRFNTVVVGALLGLMLGLVLAFVQETLDTSIGTIEDVESYLEIPVLGVVPHIDPRETTQRLIERRPALTEVDAETLRNHALLVTHFDPKSPVAEAYRTLRTNIQFARLERAGKVLLLTSPTLQEGKTTTIVNLALTMAQAGQKTLLLGANLRRPSIYRFFGIDREPGLADILVGRADWRDCIRTVADILMGRFEMEDIMASPGLDNLHIIEAGPTPANPSELISTRAMAAFIATVREEYDVILIDAPPVLPVTDSAIIARLVDGVLLVYQAGKIGRLILRRAKVQLESVGAKVWGIVLNDVHTEIAGYQYTHYYTHYYGEETPTEPSRGSRGRFRSTLARVRARLRGAEPDDTNGGEREATRNTGTSDPAVTGPNPVEGELDGDTRTTAVTGPPERRGPRSSRRTPPLPIVVLALGAAAAAGAVAGSRAGWFGERHEPRALLRQRLDVPEGGANGSAVSGRGVAPVRATGQEPELPPTRTADADTARNARTNGSRGPGSRTSADTAAGVPAAIVASAPASTGGHARGGGDASLSPAVAPPRFAVEFGPFVASGDADRVESRLQQAGYQTVRFRQQTAATVYGVLIERIATVREAQALMATLREHAFPEPDVVAPGEPVTVRVGAPLPLRGAVQLAERLRGSGYHVRVAAETGEAASVVIRHGNFSAREDAEARSRELARLGLPNETVQVR